MTSPNMASLERSLQSISINDQHSNINSSVITVEPPYTAGNHSSSSVSSGNSSGNVDLSSLQLYSETPLPYFWEQCLDLKTGEIYYINWRTGMRSDEDPRTNPEIIIDNTEYYNSEDDDDSCSYDSEGYSSSYSDNSSPPSVVLNEKDLCQYKITGADGDEEEEEQVLVVTGCKSCLMYFMVPKLVEECPKCCGQLLHFDH